MEIDFFFLREREQWKCNLKQLLAFFLYKKKVVTALAYSDNKVNAVPLLTAMQTLANKPRFTKRWQPAPASIVAGFFA
jgi:hypothetical protein